MNSMSIDLTQVQKTLKAVFGHDQFRGEQQAIVESALSNESCLVLMPTGMGKSLCFQLPAVLQKELVLVISPLIALMQDQVDRAKQLGIQATAINSSLGKEERDFRYQGLKEGKYHLLYVTPERFKKPEFLEVIKTRKISLLAVDEAHCISQWGHDFRPDYSRLGEFRELLGNPPVMALTATATPKVQMDIKSQLKIELSKTFEGGLERPNLALNFHDVYGMDEKVRNIVALTHQQSSGAKIIYFSLISTLHKVSNELGRLNIRHLVYHGDLSSQDRKRNQKLFIEQDNQLILATPAFGLGVDKSNVRLLIHAETPNSVESYFQEVGRAGRDGKESFCHLFYDQDDISIQMEFIKWANPEPEFIARVYDLIETNSLRLEQEGFDFLRGQMNFYNKRDYRVETAVNLLERWGCLKEADNKFGYHCVVAPAKEQLNEELVKTRIRTQNEKLLEMVKLATLEDGCRMQEVLKYFGHESGPCQKCDLCLS